MAMHILLAAQTKRRVFSMQHSVGMQVLFYAAAHLSENVVAHTSNSEAVRTIFAKRRSVGRGEAA